MNYFIEIQFFSQNTKLLTPNGSGDYWADITSAVTFLLLCWAYNGSISGSDNCVHFIMYVTANFIYIV